MKFIYPNFEKSNVNITATLAEYFNYKTSLPSLPILKKELEKNYKNVVFFIFDGLGYNNIKYLLNRKSFLRKNIKQKLTSVFPSTTTNATTSLISATPPMEHGYFGWSIYYSQLNRNIDIYLGSDSQTKELIPSDYVSSNYPFEPVYNLFNTDYIINTVFPKYIKTIANNNYYYENIDEMINQVKNVCNSKGKQFIYCYCEEPDHSMHHYGPSSQEVKELVNHINTEVENLAKTTEDTLIIITSDHGQTDITQYFDIINDKEMMDLLKTPPFLDFRATAFLVKDDQKTNFEKLFNKKFGKYFKLFKTSNLIKKGVFGVAKKDHSNLLGDYISVAKKTNVAFKLNNFQENSKGHHSSLLKKEMEVALILITSKK